jgi:hypothetical protein
LRKIDYLREYIRGELYLRKTIFTEKTEMQAVFPDDDFGDALVELTKRNIKLSQRDLLKRVKDLLLMVAERCRSTCTIRFCSAAKTNDKYNWLAPASPTLSICYYQLPIIGYDPLEFLESKIGRKGKNGNQIAVIPYGGKDNYLKVHEMSGCVYFEITFDWAEKSKEQL